MPTKYVTASSDASVIVIVTCFSNFDSFKIVFPFLHSTPFSDTAISISEGLARVSAFIAFVSGVALRVRSSN